LSRDIFEPLGTVWRKQVRPNESIDDPLLTPVEEIAWRTAELANLPTGACYWLLKGRPYKARRIQVLRPTDAPPAISLASGEPSALSERFAAAISERSSRRARAAGFSDDARAA
jgi:hypothetical protein